MTAPSQKIAAFRRFLLSWYAEHKRDLPWRKTTDPYHILVSEVMLQQTQVDRVIPKYRTFLDTFPMMEALAKASPAAVLKAWSGLGYNRRALYLQQAAQQIVAQGNFPQTAEELQQLPGIGAYTSRSLLIFAFNKDEAAIDTNIRRILIHEFGLSEESSAEELLELARKLLPSGKSRDWHNALMDYGALHLTAKSSGIRPLSRQSRFQGSRRQYRGAVLKVLVDGKNPTLQQLARQWQKEKSWIKELLQEMEKEGLLQLREGRVFFKQ
ncbi:MAG: Fe-S cluster assembly protein HesB [Nanoarchaeota archaeon]|nr:Fe-S cluster assembly protein HesB [Nanoarchaeota archaeon]